MATNAFHALWAEPRPTHPPDRGPRGWALVAALVCWSLVEVVLRQDLTPRPLLLLDALAVLGPLLWRRTHPLVAARTGSVPSWACRPEPCRGYWPAAGRPGRLHWTR